MITLYPQTYQGSLATSTSTAASTPTAATTDTSRFADQLLEATQTADSTGTPPDSLNTLQTTTNAPAPDADMVTTPVPTTAEAPNTTGVSAAVRNFIEWQGTQPNPFGQGTISDVWAKQGITDPLNNPVLISQAQNQLYRAEQRSAINPHYVAEWTGDWKAQMAEAKANETQRQSFLAAADALGKVAVGGGIASMTG